ncbi:MAG: VWA domain-containing protein [Syntrophales bacterium]
MGITLSKQRGVVLVLFALLLPVLLGFLAMAIDVGAWYLVRAELSKSVDAAALAGAKNIVNPNVDPAQLAKEFGIANFPAGYLGTPTQGAGTVTFAATVNSLNHNVSINGSVNAPILIAQLFGFNKVTVTNSGVAQKNPAEIMLVLDRSGSMAGKPESDLKSAATDFVSDFSTAQDQDRMGSISFATGVTVDCPLSYNFVTPMTSAIKKMTAVGATNAEDAIAQAGGSQGLPDQSGLTGDQRVKQFLIFFTDGHPTAFRGKFKNNGNDNIDAVACGTGNFCDTVYPLLGTPNSENWTTTNPQYTGTGNTTGTCSSVSGIHTTAWYVFSQYPVSGSTDPQKCNISQGTLSSYICATAIQMAQDNAQTLKDRGVYIYTIGLGTNVDQTFLQEVASNSSSYYYAPTSSELTSIFNAIAKDIQLRLTQ